MNSRAANSLGKNRREERRHNHGMDAEILFDMGGYIAHPRRRPGYRRIGMLRGPFRVKKTIAAIFLRSARTRTP